LNIVENIDIKKVFTKLDLRWGYIIEVVSFTDDIIVGTKEEKGHNEVVEKVVKQLAENYLYIKSEKCKWKIIKIGFFRVVIRSEGIKSTRIANFEKS